MENLKDTWKEIRIAPNYEINKLGEVRNKKTNHILQKKSCYKLGGETINVKYLIADAFIPNPNNCEEVKYNFVKSEDLSKCYEWYIPEDRRVRVDDAIKAIIKLRPDLNLENVNDICVNLGINSKVIYRIQKYLYLKSLSLNDEFLQKILNK